jgi:hypothetical protein
MQLNEMNGKMISGKPLYVAFAQRKEARKAMLQVTLLEQLVFYIVLTVNDETVPPMLVHFGT